MNKDMRHYIQDNMLFENNEEEMDLDEMFEFASSMDESDDVIDEDDLYEMDELSEDQLFEDEAQHEDTMTDEELKVESLKIATNIAKLMSDVTTEDIISIADKVSGFIRDHKIGSDAGSETEDNTNEEDLGLDDFPSLENDEESEENDEDKE